MPSPSDDMRSTITGINNLGVEIAVASNSPRSIVYNRFVTAGIEPPKHIASRDTMEGIRKPSPNYIYCLRDMANVDITEIAYIGDSDMTDMYCAINASVIPLSARYSNNTKYGVPIRSPKSLYRYIKHFGQQDEPYFGWRYSDSDKLDIRAVICDHARITHKLKKVLKNDSKVQLKHGVDMKTLLFHYLVSQLYMSGLLHEVDKIAVYPGHKKGSYSQTINEFVKLIDILFKNKFMNNLIVRHTTTRQSKRGNRSIKDQLSTIKLGDTYKSQIRGQTILVIDDFTTSGTSLDAARNLLYMAGATKVICLALAKYRNTHKVYDVVGQWDPFDIFRSEKHRITKREVKGRRNTAADNYFYNKIYDHYKH